MPSLLPHHTDDTNAMESVLDLGTGIKILIQHLETLCASIAEADNHIELMGAFGPVLWLALRLQNDVDDALEKVDALPRAEPANVVEAAR